MKPHACCDIISSIKRIGLHLNVLGRIASVLDFPVEHLLPWLPDNVTDSVKSSFLSKNNSMLEDIADWIATVAGDATRQSLVSVYHEPPLSYPHDCHDQTNHCQDQQSHCLHSWPWLLQSIIESSSNPVPTTDISCRIIPRRSIAENLIWAPACAITSTVIFSQSREETRNHRSPDSK